MIKVLLIVVFLATLAYFTKSGQSMRVSAWKRLLLVAFVIAAMLAVLFPDELTVFANLLGVGRGADLLLYATVAGLVFALLSIYAKFKATEEQIAELARHLAVLESLLGEAAPKDEVSDEQAVSAKPGEQH